MVRVVAPNPSPTTSPASTAPAHARRHHRHRHVESRTRVAGEVSQTPYTPTRLPRGLPYLRLRTRYLLIAVASFAWAGFSLYLALPWISQLGHAITVPLAVAVVVGIAVIPGYLNAHLLTTLLLEKPPPLRFNGQFPAVTVVIAAYNEGVRIAETLAHLQRQDYPGPLRILVADDGSTDDTSEIAARAALADPRISLIALPHRGKAHTLTSSLSEVKTPILATVDADTLLIPSALRCGVTRLLISPPDTVAVAGSMMVRNSRNNLLTRAQQWDYVLGIASIKAAQSLTRGTLVAQGAFSVFDTEAVRAVGGWPDAIGEDIVLTWSLLRRGWRTTHEPQALAFTSVPESLTGLVRQRRRWARGMIEGLRAHGIPLLGSGLAFTQSIAADFALPYLDLVYTLAFPAGIVLACFGIFAIVGPMTLAVLPLNGLLATIMYLRARNAFRAQGLVIRRARLGFLLFILGYQLLLSPVAVAGYAQELLRLRRRW
jgi:poly-beta-1,6-N-acetyl-D-glucosamine synthase